MSTTKQYDDNMTGILGKNSYKTKDNQPDNSGRCKIRGIWFWVSSWTKQGSTGPFESLAFTEMTAEDAAKYEAKSQARSAPQQGNFAGQQQQPQQQAPVNQQPPSRPEGTANPDAQDFSEDIPF